MLFPFFFRRGPQERLETSFRWLEQRPFAPSDSTEYAARYESGCYLLSVRKDSYFAWETFTDERRFGDFVLEADVELDPSNGHSAVGVVIRHGNDENFYAFLVSSRGNYRFDLLFNNNPMRLVEWTRLPEAEGAVRRLQLVAHGSHFTFRVDDEWVGEIDDGVIPSGSIGFAAQNFAGSGRGVFRLRRLMVDARPLSVEREHLRWTYFFPVSPAARMRMADTLFTMGNASAAAIQARKALKDREGTVAERLFLARCYGRLSLYEEALSEIEEILRREPRNKEACLEKANLLYLANRLLEARDHIAAGVSDGTLEAGPALWGLLGNAEYGLGNWQKSADAYLRAVALQPDAPAWLRNAARGLEMAGRSREALDLYLRASRVLFGEEAYDELSLVLPRVRALDPRNAEGRALEAKMLYHEGKTEEALRILLGLADSGTADSSVHYLIGLILGRKGKRREALPHLQRAADTEPEFALYHFRLAETLHFLGEDPRQSLERAYGLAPNDPWINNLSGALLLEAGNPAAALDFLRRARDAAPGESDIGLNLSEALSLAGKAEEALGVLDSIEKTSPQNARTANQRGIVLSRQGNHAEAVEAFESAIRLDPENLVYKENCAAECIQIDMVHRAEELLGQVEPARPSPSVYSLLGNVAVLKGESARAELAFTAGLGLDPDDPDLKVSLAQLHSERGRHEKAKSLLESALAVPPWHPRARQGRERALQALDRLRAEREQRLACSACGREWWAPRDLPPQPGFRVRGEPPGEAPAGMCPKCGKLFCVRCASEHVREDLRLQCPDCGEPLKLSTDALKWLLARSLEGASGPSSP